jgi:hypothetical protein
VNKQRPWRIYNSYAQKDWVLRLGMAAGVRVATLSIAKFGKLEELVIVSDVLTSLPREIGKLSQLSRVTLECQQLMALPPQIGDLQNLKELRLFDCSSLRSLPKELDKLQNLKCSPARILLFYDKSTL